MSLLNNDQAMLEHTRRLDRLYLAAEEAFKVWYQDSTPVNRRRWRYYRGQYEKAVIDGAHRFGLPFRNRRQST